MADGRFFVPLNAICSRKWEMPLFFLPSYLLPAPTITMAVALSNDDIGIMMTLKPFLRTFRVYFIEDYYSKSSELLKALHVFRGGDAEK